MRYLSLFSGIEAATAAWYPLGWQCVGHSEIEPFCVRLLAERYPDVPNLGDITSITEEDIALLGPIDAIIFGSPCQDLSVAGAQKGFTNDNGDTTRSGLFFTAMRIIGWARKHCGLRFALWENVPGAFSSNKGRDFAAVVDQLAGMEGTEPPAKGWGTEGCAVGSEAMVEWAVLDAQWFGVAQRRRRVFALADFGDWASRPPVLLESESVRGDTAPRREAGETITHPITPRLTSSGKGFERSGDIRGQDPVVAVGRVVGAFGGNNTKGAIDVATACNAKGGTSRLDFESESFVVMAQPVAGALNGSGGHAYPGTTLQDACAGLMIVEPGTPAVAYRTAGDSAVYAEGDRTAPLTTGTDANANIVAFGIPGNWIGRKPENGGNAVEPMHDVAPCLTKADQHAVAFSAKDFGADATQELSPTLRAGGHQNSHANSGNWMAVQQGMQVRRLTPTECERLQGFPDGYTASYKAADGPRYKALGNSMAVPVIRWIGEKMEIARMFS